MPRGVSAALITSLVIHGVIMLIASISYIPQTKRTYTRTERLKDTASVEFFPPKKPPRPSVRGGSMARYIGSKYMVAKPTVSADRTAVTEQVQVQPRGTSAVIHRPSSVQPQTVLEFSNKVVKLDSPIQPTIPASSVPRRSPPVSAPEAAKIGAVNGESVQVKVAFERPAGLAIVEHIGAPRNASGDVVENITLGNEEVPLLNPPNGTAYHDMYFKGAGTNPFIDTEDDHLSTFAMDVDAGSYSITRRYLTDGHLPPPEAVPCRRICQRI